MPLRGLPSSALPGRDQLVMGRASKSWASTSIETPSSSKYNKLWLPSRALRYEPNGQVPVCLCLFACACKLQKFQKYRACHRVFMKNPDCSRKILNGPMPIAQCACVQILERANFRLPVPDKFVSVSITSILPYFTMYILYVYFLSRCCLLYLCYYWNFSIFS